MPAISADLSCARAENAPWLCTFSLISTVCLRFAILEEKSDRDLPDVPSDVLISHISNVFKVPMKLKLFRA